MTAQQLADMIRRGMGTPEKPDLEREIDDICDRLVGLVQEHQRLSLVADNSKNAYKKRYAQEWAALRSAHAGDRSWTAKDIEQAVIHATLIEELVADMDDTVAKAQGELIDVTKMVLAGKRTILQSVLAEWHNTTGRGGSDGLGA